MTGRAWTKRELAMLRRLYPITDTHEIARRLGRTSKAVKTRAKLLRLKKANAHQPWSAAEIRTLKKLYGRMPMADLSARFNRPFHKIYNAAQRHGLSKPIQFLSRDPKLRAFIRDRHAKGWSDAEMATEWGRIDRRWLAKIRQGMGFGSNNLSEHRRRRVAAKTREQCRNAGVKSLAEVRARAFAKYAVSQGWPADLPPRCVQILNAIWEHGPMTRRELVDRLGMPWKGVRKSLCGRVHGGTYTAYLMRRGLLVSLGRKKYNGAQGRNTFVYSLPLDIKRRKIMGGVPAPAIAKGVRAHCRSADKEMA